jgi:hypothetical protein
MMEAVHQQKTLVHHQETHLAMLPKEDTLRRSFLFPLVSVARAMFNGWGPPKVRPVRVFSIKKVEQCIWLNGLADRSLKPFSCRIFLKELIICSMKGLVIHPYEAQYLS